VQRLKRACVQQVIAFNTGDGWSRMLSKPPGTDAGEQQQNRFGFETGEGDVEVFHYGYASTLTSAFDLA
jgi:hypothetical protein